MNELSSQTPPIALSRLLENLKLLPHSSSEEVFVEMFTLSLADALQREDVVEVCSTHFLAGNYYRANGKYGKAVNAYKNAMESAVQINDTARIAAVDNELGRCYEWLGLFNDALVHYQHAFSLNKSLQRKKGMASNLNNIGIVYSLLREWEPALECLLQSLAIKLELQEEPDYIAGTYNNIGNVYKGLGNYNQALEYFGKALELKQQSNNSNATASTFNNLGDVYVQLGDTQTALEFYMRSLAIKETMLSESVLFTTLCGISTALAYEGDVNQAFNFVERALHIAQQTESPFQLSEAHQKLSQLFETTSNWEKAFEHHKLHVAFLQEYSGKDMRSRFQELTIVFELDRAIYQKEVEQLRAEKLELELQIKNKELTTLALNLSQKNQLLSHVKETIIKHKLALPEPTQSIFAELEHDIQSETLSQYSWHTFEQNFKTIHHDFVQKLSQRYPDLTPTELKLCALLKLNLSNKEIANILRAETKTVETYRYRIRKKMNLETTINLVSFLASL